MIVTYLGAEAFKVSHGDITIALNPISKDSKLKPTRFGADIAVISLEHPDMNGADQVSHGDKQPVEVRGPGEYEIQDILIKGFATESAYGGTDLINTAYLITMEKMTMLYLGALNTKKLPGDLKELLEVVDILFVPIGGDGVLDAHDAHELAVAVEPKVIIPMHYGTIGTKDALGAFLKEEGVEGMKVTEKLTVRPRELEDKQGEVVVLG